LTGHYGAAGRFTLRADPPRGTVAELLLPLNGHAIPDEEFHAEAPARRAGR
jgi:hypothetical protein